MQDCCQTGRWSSLWSLLVSSAELNTKCGCLLLFSSHSLTVHRVWWWAMCWHDSGLLYIITSMLPPGATAMENSKRNTVRNIFDDEQWFKQHKEIFKIKTIRFIYEAALYIAKDYSSRNEQKQTQRLKLGQDTNKMTQFRKKVKVEMWL